MPREFSRSRRVEEAIQRILSTAIADRVRDPRVAGVMVTEVKVTRDLSLARIHYATLSGKPVTDDLQAGLKAAAGFLRTEVARELRIRSVPELRFEPDHTLLRARALEDLIHTAVGGEAGKHSGPTTLAGDPTDHD